MNRTAVVEYSASFVGVGVGTEAALLSRADGTETPLKGKLAYIKAELTGPATELTLLEVTIGNPGSSVIRFENDPGSSHYKQILPLPYTATDDLYALVATDDATDATDIVVTLGVEVG